MIGRWIVSIVNLILVVLLTWRVIEINNDKMYIAFILGYTFIIGANLLLWAILALSKSKLDKIMGRIILGLVLLFVPLMVVVSRA